MIKYQIFLKLSDLHQHNQQEFLNERFNLALFLFTR